MVSLCDGIGAVWCALSEYQLPHEGMAAEIVNELRDHTAVKWQKLDMAADALKVDAEEVLKTAKRKGCQGIFLSAGPSCQPFSVLGRQRGFGDQRTDVLDKSCALAVGLRELCKQEGRPFRYMIEEVSSMAQKHRDRISATLGETPVLIQAADWGVIQRARLFWGLSSLRLRRDPRYTMEPVGQSIPGVAILRWRGQADPTEWKPDSGWTWNGRDKLTSQSPPIPGTGWTTTWGGGRIKTLTTCFPHPMDKGNKNDGVAVQNFRSDGGRFPLAHYTDDNVLQDETGSLPDRPLNAAERERAMGFPRNYTRGLTLPGKNSEDSRCHALGNTFHVPSILLMLLLLFDLSWAIHPQQAAAETAEDSNWAQAHLRGSLWDTNHPDVQACARNSSDTFEDILSMFPQNFFPRSRIRKSRTAFKKVYLGDLAHWDAYVKACGEGHRAAGVDTDALTSKRELHIAAGRQRNVAGAKHCPATRLPRDLSYTGHEEAAKRISHPFENESRLELDAQFAVEGLVRMGRNATRWRSRVSATLRKISRALAPLDNWALNKRPTQHVAGWSPVLTACWVSLLDWPDRDLPLCLVEGFQVIGRIPPSNIHKKVEYEDIPDADLRAELLGDNAAAFVDSLETDLRIHEHAEEILKVTLEEIGLGLARPLETRQELDQRFGRGGWRPMPRHLVFQEDKSRPIDDARKGKQNRLTVVEETIVCQSGEWVAQTWKAVLQEARHLLGQWVPLPSWLVPEAGTEDMWKGFRQNHARREDECCCVVTFVDPRDGKRKYSRMRGLPFGMGSVVNQFNRVPHLLTAVQRRFLCVLCAHYFDDSIIMDLSTTAPATKAQCKRLTDFWGIKFSDKKRQRMHSLVTFLGHQYDLASLRSAGSIVFGVKPSTRAKCLKQIQEALDSNTLTSGGASKLRGLLQWIDTGISGRPCRGALCALVARQYWEDLQQVTPRLRTALEYLRLCVETMPSRNIPMTFHGVKKAIVYSDASTDGPEGGLRVGILVVAPGEQTECATVDVPPEIVELWGFRKTYIGQGELLAGPLAQWLFSDRLRGRLVTWYMDNTSACAALVKASSPQFDSSAMALVAGLQAQANGSLVWVEYINTKQNPSDCLSRGGLADPVARRKLRSGAWVAREVGAIPWKQLFKR